MTDSNLRPEASTGISADAVGDCHAAVRLELALAIKGRCSPAEYGARTTHTVGARVETAISGTVQIGPFGGRARSAPEEYDNGGETAHVHILAGALPSEIPEQQPLSSLFWARITSAARASAQLLFSTVG